MKSLGIGRHVIAAIVLSAAGAGARAQCDDGSIVVDPDAGTIAVSYVTRDEGGTEVPHAITMIRPTRFVPVVDVRTSFDAPSGLHRYRYTIANSASSEQQIGDVLFGVSSRVHVSDRIGPSSPGWDFFPDSGPDTFAWGFLSGSPRPDMSIEGIPQGGSATFSFTSPSPPGEITVYLRGVEPDVQFPDLPGCLEDALIDETGFPRDYVAVMTTGPVAP